MGKLKIYTYGYNTEYSCYESSNGIRLFFLGYPFAPASINATYNDGAKTYSYIPCFEVIKSLLVWQTEQDVALDNAFSERFD